MSKVFDIDRNGECICGSGRKYKKCCFPSIDKIDTTLLKTIEKEETITLYGKEFIHIVSVLYGVRLEEESQNPPDLEELAKTILEAWYEKDSMFDEEERFAAKNTVEELLNRIGEIIEEKETLKHFRVPVDFLMDTDLQTEEEVNGLLEKISRGLFLEDYLLDLAYSLRNEEYSREELKTVFIWILLAAKDDGIKDFMIPVLKVTIDELNKAQARFNEIVDKDNGQEDDDERKFFEMLEIYQEYPIFGEYAAKRLLLEIGDDLDKILACIDFSIPFYMIYEFYLRLFTNIVDILYNKQFPIDKEMASYNAFLVVWDDLLKRSDFMDNLYETIMNDVLNLKEKQDGKMDENLENALEKLITFFGIPPMTIHFSLINVVFIKFMANYFNTLPRPIDDSGIILEDLDQIVSNEFFERYISYLQSKNLTDVVTYLKEIYGELENVKLEVKKEIKEILRDTVLQK